MKILVFLVLTSAFSSISYAFVIASGTLGAWVVPLMWSPGVAGLITQICFHRSIRGLGWSLKPAKYLLPSYALPVCYGTAIYVPVWFLGIAPFAPADLAKIVATQVGIHAPNTSAFVIVYVAVLSTVGVAASCATALGEEIGWRGVLVPELARRFSFPAVALVSGAVWALWHCPAIVYADYNDPSVPVGYQLVCFTVFVVGISFPFAWLRLRSGSLWTAVLLHASHNLFLQMVFTPLTGRTGLAPYLIGDFGAGLAVAGVVVAWLFWRRRGDCRRASAPACTSRMTAGMERGRTFLEP